MTHASEIWNTRPTVELVNSFCDDTLAGNLGIEIIEVGDDFLRARMPVDHRTVQVFRILHGGASASLAETLGSIAGAFCVDVETKYVVGLEINCNHVRSASDGFVYGTARPIHLGSSTQIWDIRILDEREKLVCISRLTLAVLDHKTD
jgi:1,4-dihydroxy-2-naphthoyl-CoA hydrolase